jgi:hypothetical protein
MPYSKPKAEVLVTKELCHYGCNHQANFKFANGKVCCSASHNSCPKKRKDFSDRTDHKITASKSLATRTKLGITKTSQIKGGATRKSAGHYKKLAKIMQEHWIAHPWKNNKNCPLELYKNTSINFQGTFEYKFLEELEQENGIEWVNSNVKRGPSIWYIDPTDNTERLYISDFIIDNTVYEIKSGWTWNKHGTDLVLEEKNKTKLTACIKLGYNVVLILNQNRINYGKTTMD